jgi:hypothetical protein
VQVISFNTNVGRFFERWGLHDRCVPASVCLMHTSRFFLLGSEPARIKPCCLPMTASRMRFARVIRRGDVAEWDRRVGHAAPSSRIKSSARSLPPVHRIYPLCGHAHELRLHNQSGELLTVQPYPQRIGGSYAYNGHRGELHAILLAHARDIGVEVRLGCAVEEYYEDAARGVASS